MKTYLVIYTRKQHGSKEVRGVHVTVADDKKQAIKSAMNACNKKALTASNFVAEELAPLVSKVGLKLVLKTHDPAAEKQTKIPDAPTKKNEEEKAKGKTGLEV